MSSERFDLWGVIRGEQPLARRLGVTTHVSPLRYKAERLKADYPSAGVQVLEDWLADQELYISHFFREDQVVLTPEWRAQRCPIPGAWRHVSLCRLGNADLLLSKLMRDDPIDHGDACFILSRSSFTREDVRLLLERARVPDIPDVVEQFERASRRLLDALAEPGHA